MEGKRILIVEDEVIVALDIESKLQDMGYEVVAAVNNGADAIEVANSERIDIALMDINIQGDLDGIETAQHILETHDIPFVFLTAYSNSDVFERSKEIAPYGYLLKPFEQKELQVGLDLALHKHDLDVKIRGKNRELEGKIKERSKKIKQISNDLDAEALMRLRVEQRLEEREVRFKVIVQNLGSGLLLVDEKGLIDEVNPAALDLLGFGEEELLRKSVKKLFEAKENWSELTVKIDDKVHVIEEIFLHKNGDQIYVNLSFSKTENNEIIISIVDITNEKQNEKLLQKEREMRLQSLFEGAENERKRLAAELHDSLGQKLTAIKLTMGALIKMSECDGNREVLVDCKNLVEETILESRRISHNLVSSVLADFGLVEVISRTVDEMNGYSGANIKFEQPGKYIRLDMAAEIGFYRVVQEALNNAIKYAKATDISVCMSQKKVGQCELEVIDNGNGFDYEKVFKDAGGHGLYNMNERALALGAQYSVKSKKGKGTKVKIEI